MAYSGDHLVGWANASVRTVAALPDLGDVSKAKGIVREDDIQAAFSQDSSIDYQAGEAADFRNSGVKVSILIG